MWMGFEEDKNKLFGGYDPDSSPAAWEVYRKIYTGKDWAFWDMFDLQALKADGKPNARRLLAKAKKSSEWDYVHFFGSEEKAEKWRRWADEDILFIAGDIDFNFKRGCAKGYQKYEYYERLIQDMNGEKDEKKNLLARLQRCEKRHHSLGNFSLMPVSGGMNKAKAITNHRDRIDRFIWLLDQYFKERRKWPEDDAYLRHLFSCADGTGEDTAFFCKITSGVSGSEAYKIKCREIIYEYLSLFHDPGDPDNDIYDYCAKIYKMDREMTDAFLSLGEKAGFRGGDVVEYMELAERYWRMKRKVIDSAVSHE